MIRRARALRIGTRGLESIAQSLQKGLGAFWAIKVVSQKDNPNAFDPPASYVEARLLGVCLQICEDGEVYLQGVYPHQDGVLLVGNVPVTVSKDLATWAVPDRIRVAGVADHVVSMFGGLNGQQPVV